MFVRKSRKSVIIRDKCSLAKCISKIEVGLGNQDFCAENHGFSQYQQLEIQFVKAASFRNRKRAYLLWFWRATTCERSYIKTRLCSRITMMPLVLTLVTFFFIISIMCYERHFKKLWKFLMVPNIKSIALIVVVGGNQAVVRRKKFRDNSFLKIWPTEKDYSLWSKIGQNTSPNCFSQFSSLKSFFWFADFRFILD